MLLETQGTPSQQGAEEGQLLNGRKLMGRFLTYESGGVWVISSETGGKSLFSEKGKGCLVFEMSVLGYW